MHQKATEGEKQNKFKQGFRHGLIVYKHSRKYIYDKKNT